jgi:predicted CXXCH cytochrome family protein
MAVVALAFVSAGVQVARGVRARRSAETLDRRVPHEARVGYAGSASCRGCHPSEYASWRASYHRTMTQRATVDALIAPAAFDARTLRGIEGEHQVERRGDELWVRLVSPSWKLAHLDDEPEDTIQSLLAGAPRGWQRVLMTTGSHHMQVYWVAGATSTTLHAFPFAYMLEPSSSNQSAGRWVPNESTLLRPPIEGGVYTWNEVCIKCHAVAVQPRLAGPKRRADDTRVAEFGIACEACHGPSAEHAARYSDPILRYSEHFAATPMSEVVNPGALDHETSSELCGQCHAITRFIDDERWRDGGSEFTPGQRLAPHMRPVRHPLREVQPWMDEELEATPDFFAQRYWPDGMVRISGREFNGVLESPCYQRGELSCASCHSMHHSDPDDQLARGMEGEGACVSCHERYADDARLIEHTHHARGSSGSGCYDCHMPHTTYGLLKAIRSHEISSPTVEESTLHGRPNACNLCHLDRTLAWSMNYLQAWYGIEEVALSEEQRTIAAAVLWAVSGDAGQRALAAWHLGWPVALAASGETWQAPILARLLNDTYAAVRVIAGRSLTHLPGFATFVYDAVGDPEARAAAPHAVETSWRSRRADASDGRTRRTGEDARAVLQDDEGELALGVLGRLLRARDHRPVTLAE